MHLQVLHRDCLPERRSAFCVEQTACESILEADMVPYVRDVARLLTMGIAVGVGTRSAPASSALLAVLVGLASISVAIAQQTLP